MARETSISNKTIADTQSATLKIEVVFSESLGIGVVVKLMSPGSWQSSTE
jgi:hypothetical protein